MLIYKIHDGIKISKEIQPHNFGYFKMYGWKEDKIPKVTPKKKGAKKVEEDKE